MLSGQFTESHILLTMTNSGTPKNCESLWAWPAADFQVVARTAPDRKRTLHISVWPSHGQINLQACVLNTHHPNFGSLWYSHWSIKSITYWPEMHRAKLPLVCLSHSQKGVNVLITTLCATTAYGKMCSLCWVLMWSQAEKSCLSHISKVLWHFSCILFNS